MIKATLLCSSSLHVYLGWKQPVLAINRRKTSNFVWIMTFLFFMIQLISWSSKIKLQRLKMQFRVIVYTLRSNKSNDSFFSGIIKIGCGMQIRLPVQTLQWSFSHSPPNKIGLKNFPSHKTFCFVDKLIKNFTLNWTALCFDSSELTFTMKNARSCWLFSKNNYLQYIDCFNSLYRIS